MLKEKKHINSTGRGYKLVLPSLPLPPPPSTIKRVEGGRGGGVNATCPLDFFKNFIKRLLAGQLST